MKVDIYYSVPTLKLLTEGEIWEEGPIPGIIPLNKETIDVRGPYCLIPRNTISHGSELYAHPE